MGLGDTTVLVMVLTISIAVSALMTTFSIWIANRLNVVAVPGPRSSHYTPIPRLGGIGVFLPIVGVLLLAVFSPGLLYGEAWGLQPALKTFLRLALVCGMLAFLVGLMDDFLALPPFFKLLGQIAVAGLFLWLGDRFIYMVRSQGDTSIITETFRGAGFDRIALTRNLVLDPHWPRALARVGETLLTAPSLAAILTFVWIVFFMNVYNFMDGIDGIAATFLICVAVGVFAIYVPEARAIQAMRAHILFVMAFTTILIGVALGFLFYNWPVANVFLGDGGSQFVGFLIAALLAQLTRVAGEPAADAGSDFAGQYLYSSRELLLHKRAYVDFLACVILVYPFLYDVIYTLFRRAWNRKPVWCAHHEHLYQRLIDRAWTHKEVVLFSLPFYLTHAALFYAYAWAPSERIRLMWALIALLPMFLYTAIVWAAESGQRAVPPDQAMAGPVQTIKPVEEAIEEARSEETEKK
jgi:UDP-N-acetylmuramyl pentapeptide phosphotransferase/UDP-N-acetylglucosamine-1-phosphate transferase